MTICPHCQRQRLLASSDPAALGHCLACGDIYDHIDPDLARIESARKAHAIPKRWLCPRCDAQFGHQQLLDRHAAMCTGRLL